MKTETKEWTIKDIENITEEQAKEMANDTREIKGHNIYFIDFEGHFGFSYVVFKNGHHIHYANDYELHHRSETRMGLNMLYINKINDILYTDEEITEPIKDYNDYNKKKRFLHNYYGMQVDSVSIFCIKLIYYTPFNTSSIFPIFFILFFRFKTSFSIFSFW